MKVLFVCGRNAGRPQIAQALYERRGGDACPVLPGKEYVDWNLAHPAGLCLEEVRELPSSIEELVAALPL